MEYSLINMDKTYIHFESLANIISSSPLPAIPFADFTGHGQVYNPPANHIELSYLTAGGYDKLMIGNKQFSLHAGEISLHNVHFGNYSPLSPGTKGWCVFIQTDDLALPKQWTNVPFFNSMKVNNPRKLELAFKSLAEKCRLPGLRHPGYLSGAKAYDPTDTSHTTLSRKLHIKAALLELLATITQNTADTSNHNNDNLQTIDIALEYITANFNNPDLTLEMIANHINLSDDYFGQLFKKHIGTSPILYLRTIRVEQAKVLLTHTNLPINAIAEKVGYRDPLYFSRIFKKATTHSPRQWKQI